MVDPNDVVAEFMIPVEGYERKNIAMTIDNRFVLMDLNIGSGRVPTRELQKIVIDKFRVKVRSFLNLKEVLEAAGFTEVKSDDDEVGLDLMQPSKDSLIELFA